MAENPARFTPKITPRRRQRVIFRHVKRWSDCCAVTLEEVKQRDLLFLEVTVRITGASICDFKSEGPSLSLPLSPLRASD